MVGGVYGRSWTGWGSTSLQGDESSQRDLLTSLVEGTEKNNQQTATVSLEHHIYRLPRFH